MLNACFSKFVKLVIMIRGSLFTKNLSWFSQTFNDSGIISSRDSVIKALITWAIGNNSRIITPGDSAFEA